jgi:hypothetical protein
MKRILIDRDSCYDYCFTKDSKDRSKVWRWKAVISDEVYERLQKVTDDYYAEVQGFLERIVEEQFDAKAKQKNADKKV